MKRWLGLLPWVFMAAIPYIVFQNLDFDALIVALKNFNVAFVIMAALVNLIVITLCRAGRFAALISGLPHQGRGPSFSENVWIMLAARGLNTVLPARAGETIRVMRMHQRHGFQLEPLIAAAAAESLIELIALSIPASVVVFAGLVSGKLAPLLYPLIVAGLVCGIFVYLVGVGARPKQGDRAQPSARMEKILASIQKFREGVRLLRNHRIWSRAILWNWGADLADVLMIGLCLHAVGVNLGPIEWFVILGGINVAIAIPAPGNVGTLEAGAVLVLGAFGVGKGEALAFALLYHAAHLLPQVMLGAISLRTELAPKPTELEGIDSPYPKN